MSTITMKQHNEASGPATREGQPAPSPAAAPPPASPLARVAQAAHAGRGPTAGAPPEIGLRIRDFSSWYGTFQALHNISMDIPARRVTAFIGPSGCGKSTFLRWINRMNDLIPGARSEGSLDLHGVNVLERGVDVVELRRRVGMVFQKPNPFPKSIYDNVAFGPRLHRRYGRGEMDALVEKSLKAAALWNEVKDRLKNSALSLSGGQQQRLCIARAIAVGPEVLLMDEPCSALDPQSTLRVEELIAELRKQYTIIIVTHNMQQAARVSDMTGFFNVGHVVEFGSTLQLFTRPSQKATEDYVTGRFG